ncbi:Cutinase [Lasiodiplodia theobromae]|uniref:Cutinase n=1 Tax=Lasiodiplodia theobromae TaxID=45133 RepID=UPI0015C2D6E0|nr:Cutinase [Lasiodiplodia theobromae]KAF4536460.1 Cutinase [Lasiodiplodia theobromae]
MKISTFIPIFATSTVLAVPTFGHASHLDVEKFVARISEMFPGNITVSDSTPGLVQSWKNLSAEFHLNTEEDAVATDRKCSDITVVFARGTTEVSNVGVLVGPPFLDALRQRAGRWVSVAMQGVEYAANMTGYAMGGDPDGSQRMADYVEEAMTACPQTKLVISGYSQGAQLTHNAAKLLPANVTSKISSAVTFGDPYLSEPFQGMSNATALKLCNEGDGVCQAGATIGLQHLVYARRVAEAADFVMSRAGY